MQFVIFLLIVVVMYIGLYSYSWIMDDVKIIQYLDSRADNLDYQSIRIRAVVPEDKYLGDKTMNAIRVYVIIRSKNVPNNINIVLYDNMEKFSDCESYAEASFEN